MLQELLSVRFQDQYLSHKKPALIFLLSSYLQLPLPSEYELPLESDDLLTNVIYSRQLKKEDARVFWKGQIRKHTDRPEAIKSYWKANRRPRISKILDDCKITFLGGGEKIGGTSILVNVKGHRILLDAGMHLTGDQPYPDYSNLEGLDLDLKAVDALLISHAHLDHTGGVPYVFGLNPDLPIYASEPTIRLMKLLLMDTYKNKQNNDSETTNIKESDIERVMLHINNIAFNHSVSVPSSNGTAWKVTYYPSGHILGAGAIHLEIENISILFTGDYSVEDQKTVTGIKLPDNLQVDILITESTYGFLPTNASIPRALQEKMFVESIIDKMKHGGNILIPSFALGRAQEIIRIIKDHFCNETYLPFNLFTDGRVTEVCRIYNDFWQKGQFINPELLKRSNEDVFFSQGVQAAQNIYSGPKSTYSFQSFMNEYIQPGNNCIVASSGMLSDHTASAHYAEHLIENPLNTLCFTGYLDEESPGSTLIRELNSTSNSKVLINGEKKELNASVNSFRLSAHASREDITELIIELQPRVVFLMHGEHQKRYQPVETIVSGEFIYPSIIELLKPLSAELQVIPAFNGTTYTMN